MAGTRSACRLRPDRKRRENEHFGCMTYDLLTQLAYKQSAIPHRQVYARAGTSPHDSAGLTMTTHDLTVIGAQHNASLFGVWGGSGVLGVSM